MSDKNKVLVIVDMQNDFIDGSLGTKEAQGIVDKMVEYIKNFNGDIITTQDTHYNDSDLNFNYFNTMEGKKLPVLHCVIGTDGWKINSKIEEACKENAEKNGTNYSTILKLTFGSDKLPEIINKGSRKNGQYDEVYMCGVCTDICVVSNALLLKADSPNREMFILEDLCAGVTPEKHKSALDVLQSCQCDVVKAFDKTLDKDNQILEDEMER